MHHMRPPDVPIDRRPTGRPGANHQPANGGRARMVCLTRAGRVPLFETGRQFAQWPGAMGLGLVNVNSAAWSRRAAALPVDTISPCVAAP